MTYVNDGALHRRGGVGLPGRAVKLAQDRLDTPLVGRTEVTPVSDSTAAQRGMQRESGGALRVGVAGFKGTRTSEEIMVRNSFGARGRLTVGAMTCEVFRLQRVEGAARLPYSLKAVTGEPAAQRVRRWWLPRRINPLIPAELVIDHSVLAESSAARSTSLAVSAGAVTREPGTDR